MILECSRKGDARFSAFNARFQDGQSIEERYQLSKRDRDGKAFGATWRECKGQMPFFIAIGDTRLYAPTFQHDWYRLLWEDYLLRGHLDLFTVAITYKGFTDFFDGTHGHIYVPKPGYEHGDRCSQAAAIASLVYEHTHAIAYVYPEPLLELYIKAYLWR